MRTTMTDFTIWLFIFFTGMVFQFYMHRLLSRPLCKECGAKAMPNQTLAFIRRAHELDRAEAKLEQATKLSQEIHDYLKKRGDERHGLIGNLRCIYDHVLRDIEVPR